MPHPVPPPSSPSPGLPERRHTPAAARSPYLAAVREAWQRAHAANNADDPGLGLALAAYARDGRAREVAGTWLIRSYYRGD